MLEAFTWFRQSAYRYSSDGLIVYIDPWGVEDDAPEADLILITHAHQDHYQPELIPALSGSRTSIVAPRDIAAELSGDVTAVAPGECHTVAGVNFTTVPAYNTREEALEFHPKANRWVGYIVELGGTSYYHAGDTDHAPELDDVKSDVAFLPVGGYYTMDVPQAANLARTISPRVAVPMHYGYVVGSKDDGERFKQEAAPVAVEVMSPTNPFER
jgi:L-ascorbate metabolism protein UlaG (beta-lactamase superfamily)